MTKYIVKVPSENMEALLCEFLRTKLAFEKASNKPIFKPLKFAMEKGFGMPKDTPAMSLNCKKIDDTTIDLDLIFMGDNLIKPHKMIEKLKVMMDQYNATIERAVPIHDEAGDKDEEGA